MDLTNWNSVGVVVGGAVLATLSAWFMFQKNQAVKKADGISAEHVLLLKRVDELETKVRVSDAMFMPLANAYQQSLIKILTHAHTEELDLLLAKVGKHTLTVEEEPRLLALLDERVHTADNLVTDDERKVATIFPIVMERASAEHALLAAAKETMVRTASLAPDNP